MSLGLEFEQEIAMGKMYISSAFSDKQLVTIIDLLERWWGLKSEGGSHKRVNVLHEFNACGHV